MKSNLYFPLFFTTHLSPPTPKLVNNFPVSKLELTKLFYIKYTDQLNRIDWTKWYTENELMILYNYAAFPSSYIRVQELN